MPIPRLILVETAAGVDRALKLQDERPGSALLALSPAVIEALEEAKRPFTIPEEHVKPSALTERGLENYRLLEELGNLVEAELPRLPEPLRLNPIFLNFFRLKIAVDSITLRALELSAVVAALKPSELVAVADDAPLWESRESVHLMTEYGPVYSAVVPLVAKAAGVGASGDAPSSEPARSGKPLSRRLAAAARATRAAAALSFGAQGAIWQLGEVAHDMPGLLEAVSKHGKVTRLGNVFHESAAFFAPRPAEERRALESFWAGLEPKLAAAPVFRCSGVDCFPLILPVLKRLFIEDLLAAAGVYTRVRALIKGAKPRAALMVHTPFLENMAATAALRAEGVPVVFAQEGGLYGYARSEMHHYAELSWGDHLLAYGRGAADYLNATRPTPRQKALSHPAGALRLRALRVARATKKVANPPTVMYVASHFPHALRYAPLCYGDREYFLLRRRALESLMRSGAKILYKGIPGRLDRDDLKSYLEKHGIEIVDAPMSAALSMADSFVLDWPTTTLLELATTDRPIRVLMDRDVVVPIDSALPSLRRRAEVFVDREAFVAPLAGPAPTTAANDDEFLEMYGTGEWDERALVGFLSGLARP